MRRGASLLGLCLGIALLAPAGAYEFVIHAGQRVCFTEDLPEGVHFQGSYAVGGVPAYAVAVEIRSPTGILYSHPNVTEDGRFAFLITSGGTHTICFLAGEASRPGAERPCLLSFDSGRLPVGPAGGQADRQATVERIAEASRVMQKHLQVQKAREEEARGLTAGIRRTAILTAVLCIVAVWAVAIVTTQWIGGMVKKRL